MQVVWAFVQPLLSQPCTPFLRTLSKIYRIYQNIQKYIKKITKIVVWPLFSKIYLKSSLVQKIFRSPLSFLCPPFGQKCSLPSFSLSFAIISLWYLYHSSAIACYWFKNGINNKYTKLQNIATHILSHDQHQPAQFTKFETDYAENICRVHVVFHCLAYRHILYNHIMPYYSSHTFTHSPLQIVFATF